MSPKLSTTLTIDWFINTATGRSTQSTITLSAAEIILGCLRQLHITSRKGTVVLTSGEFTLALHFVCQGVGIFLWGDSSGRKSHFLTYDQKIQIDWCKKDCGIAINFVT